MEREWAHGIEKGDSFNAFVIRSKRSKNLDGKEGAGKLAGGCPRIVTRIGYQEVYTKDFHFHRRYFRFRKM